MPLLYGLALSFIAWMQFAHEPALDSSWLGELLGLSKLESIVISMFFIVGLLIGQLAATLSRISSAHDRLAGKVHGWDDD